MQESDSYQKSSRKRRIAAFFIDHIVMTFVIVTVSFLVLGSNFIEEENPGRFIVSLFAVMIPGFLLYASKDSYKGISIGKWMMGIMVRDEKNTDEIPSYGRLLKRNLPVFIWPVEFIVLVTNNHKKRLGDKISDTIVVKNPDKPKQVTRILALVIVGILLFTLLFFIIGNTMKNSDAYKVAISEIEKNEQIISETGGIKGYGMMPSGSISSSNGYGQAQLEIKVLGNSKNINVNMYLEKKPDSKWEIIELE